MPANQPTPQPMIIIIADPTAQSLPFPLNDLPRYQHKSQPYNLQLYNLQPYNPQPCNTYPRENGLRRLMRQEKKLLQNTFDDFGAATRSFIGTLVSWVVWRILLPLSVLSVLWIALASPAELPV